ncbi:MAG: histidinol-phosphate transaminase [Clostridia bacterium]|nr:histidinol-phosphate transaminase [Clostridia bacterium]
MSRFFTSRYKDLDPYTPGEQPRERKYIKLNTNESPFPPSKSAIARASSEAERLMLYPDPNATELCAMMAEELGVRADQVVMTNGSDEVLNFAFMAYCDENTPAYFADITYGFYKVYANLNRVRYTEIPLDEKFRIRVEDYLGLRGTVFIANPNAPTGIALSLYEIERILAANPDNVVIIDEAYVDFGAESAVSLIDKYDNLLVTGTFSKSRSMAGARLGFGVGSAELIADINRLRYSTNPYNINRMTMAAGIGALSDREYFEKNCRTIIENRKKCSEELRALGFTMTDSRANFIFAKHDGVDGGELYLKLKERGILVRHFNGERIKQYNRITVGTAEEMMILTDNIKKILEETNEKR